MISLDMKKTAQQELRHVSWEKRVLFCFLFAGSEFPNQTNDCQMGRPWHLYNLPLLNTRLILVIGTSPPAVSPQNIQPLPCLWYKLERHYLQI